MKHRRLMDAALVAALLLAYAPELTDDLLPESTPIALIAPMQDTSPEQDTNDNPADRL